jgi:ABC-type Mn2+/Zn2+ transport system permease subunit
MSSIEQSAGKVARKSLTVWANVSMIVGALAMGVLGVEIEVEQLEAIGDGVSRIIVLGGSVAAAVVSIYGRVRASERITSLFG